MNFENYELGAVAAYHDQPPVDTPARKWVNARSITPQTTVGELLEWVDGYGLNYLESLVVTVRNLPWDR